MIYTTGTIAINGNTVTGTGTDFSAPLSLIRVGCTLIAIGNPVQIFTITEIKNGTELSVTPAANPAIPAGTKFSILLSDSISVDGLAQDVAETLRYYQGKETELASLQELLIERFGNGSALPVGAPVPWPSATPPTGWMKCNGAAFSAEEYPELAKAYPTNKLPDLRGEFIRGWDDGRGVDSGRVVLTGQSQSVQLHTHDLAMAYSSEIDYKDKLGTTPDSDLIPIKYMINVTTFNGSGWVYLKANDSTGAETRPRNLAFNYIVRAL